MKHICTITNASTRLLCFVPSTSRYKGQINTSLCSTEIHLHDMGRKFSFVNNDMNCSSVEHVTSVICWQSHALKIYQVGSKRFFLILGLSYMRLYDCTKERKDSVSCILYSREATETLRLSQSTWFPPTLMPCLKETIHWLKWRIQMKYFFFPYKPKIAVLSNSLFPQFMLRQ